MNAIKDLLDGVVIVIENPTITLLLDPPHGVNDEAVKFPHVFPCPKSGDDPPVCECRTTVG